ncbi:MAG: hypothetical protein WAU42_04625 [Solirubrobacteraceae bacterium]
MSILVTLALTTQVLTLVTYISFGIAVASLLITVYALRKGFDQAKEVERVRKAADATLDRLELVTQALSTRVLGKWPKVLRRQAELIKRTKRYLKIVVDVPSYGIFSDFNGHEEYQLALEDCLRKGHELSTIFLNKKSRRKLNEEFFAPKEAESWPQPFADAVREWHTRAETYDPTLPESTNFEEYLNALEHINQHTLRRLENAARTGGDHLGRKLFTPLETDTMFPLYLWIRDGDEAIFTVAMLSFGIQHEITFITSDFGLVKALEAAYDRYMNRLVAGSAAVATDGPHAPGATLGVVPDDIPNAGSGWPVAER